MIEDNNLKNINNIVITFPFKKYYLDIEYLFENFKNYKTQIKYDDKFKIRNVMTTHNAFFTTFSIKYDNRYTYVPEQEDNYEKVNVIGDYFCELPRVQSIGYGEKQSPFDYWKDNYIQIIKKVLSNYIYNDIIKFPLDNKLKEHYYTYLLREDIYNSVTEARLGKPTVYNTLYKFFDAKKICDPASAYGDRLLSAIACNIDLYVGVDPNKDLFDGYNEIIRKYGDKNKQIMINAPFETAKLPDTLFDLVIMSPPPFLGETYSSPEGQSVNTFNDFDNWFINFQLFICYKSYKILENNGHLIITILDRPRDNYKITELLMLSIGYKLDHFTYKGVIGWEGSKLKKNITPFWIWQKQDKVNGKKKLYGFLLKKYYGKFYDIIKKIDYKNINN